MENLIGKSISHYQILERLGEGGMATVFKAYDTNLEREVAIKIIRRAAFPAEQSDQLLKRFEREAKSLARMSHPNIVKVLDYGEYGDSPYLVLEYLPGGTLKDKLGKPTPWPEAVKLLLPIAEALDYAHSQNIIHRDVKPANILLTQRGQPMLSDFGIAKLLEGGDTQTLTGTGVGIGTPEYMAPEQWSGKVSPQTDIYALGVVFYELLTDRKPYTADTPAEILLKQATEPLPRIKAFVPDLPDEVEQILDKALAKDPADRYASMQEFGLALEGLLGRRIEVQKTTLQTPKKKPEPETVEAEGTRVSRIPERAPAAQIVEVGKPAQPRPTISWKLWGPMAGIVVLISASLILGPRLLKMAKPGVAATAKPTDTSLPLFTMTSQSLPTPSLTLTPIPTLTLMPTATATPLLRLGQSLFSELLLPEGGLDGIVFSPDGLTLTISSSPFYKNSVLQPDIYFYQVATDTLKLIHTTYIMSPQASYFKAFSPDGQIAAMESQDGTVRLWRMADGNLLQTMQGTFSAFSPDGKTLALGTQDGMVRLLRVADGSLLQTLEGHFLAFSPDGKVMATWTQDGTIRLRKVADGSLLQTLQTHTTTGVSVAFSRDGQTLTSAFADNTVRLWRVADGSLLQTLQESYPLNESVISPDGQTLAINLADFTIRLLRVGDSSMPRTLKGHTDGVTCMAFSLDGQILASGSEDKTIRLWRVSDGSLIQTLQGSPYYIDKVAFSPDGQLLASLIAGYGKVILWGVHP